MFSRRLARAVAGAWLLAALLPSPAHPQAAGRVVGRIVEAGTSRPLPGARVSVQGTGITALSGVDGRYALSGVPAGNRTIVVELIGYAPKTITDVEVDASGAVSLDVALEAAAIGLEAITVTAERERGSTALALDAQRNATGVTTAIGSEQIRKSPDSDAAQAIRRASGVTVQDGKYVFVRGLGERYSTTSLNGARLPSPEPERKTVPLDLFPAAILEGITITKTFTPDLPGDFSGAQVDLKTREFATARTATLSFSTGANLAGAFNTIHLAPGSRLDWLAAGAGARRLPPRLAGIRDFGASTPADIASYLRSFRNAWTARETSGEPNVSFGASIGREDTIFGRRTGYLASFSYARTLELRKDEQRATAVRAGLGSETRAINAYQGETGTVSVLWGGLLNLSTQLGTGTRLSFDGTYDRTADSEALRLAGLSEEYGVLLDLTRLTYTERSIYSLQLRGEHAAGQRHHVDWSVTHSGVRRSEPDRSDLAYAREVDPSNPDRQVLAWFGNIPRAATRTFAELSESSTSVGANYRIQIGGAERPAQIKVGGLYRHVTRDSDARAYDLINRDLTTEERALPAELLFDGRFFDPENPRITLNINTSSGFYTATEHLAAAYAMVEYPYGARVRVVAGGRVEHADIEVVAQGIFGPPDHARLNDTDLLPSVGLTWDLSSTQKVRLVASRTLSRPEYRELSSTTYFEYLGGQTVFGNPDLERALIHNADFRWEWYPSPGEVVSVALFGKWFDRPIERILVESTGRPAVSFVNTEGATNYGVELEVRKRLGTLSPALAPFTAFANATLVRSRIRVGNRELTGVTNDERPMMGQAPYVLNVGLTWTGDDPRTSATILYDVVGKRITEVGTGGLPDTYELPRPMLDLSLQYPVSDRVVLRLDGKNLLDRPVELRQGTVARHRYTTGRTLAVGGSVRL